MENVKIRPSKQSISIVKWIIVTQQIQTNITLMYAEMKSSAFELMSNDLIMSCKSQPAPWQMFHSWHIQPVQVLFAQRNSHVR